MGRKVEVDDVDGIEIVIERTGTHSRKITSKLSVQATLPMVWDVLTDYERLPDFIPGLTVSRLVDKRDKFARVFQIGEQKLAFGFKFNAKATIDCSEKDLQMLPRGRQRDIEFKMIEGDFKVYAGKWSVVEQEKAGLLQSDRRGSETSTLMYSVNVESKLWMPAHLVEARLSREIRINMSCLREEAERAFRNT